VTYPVPLRPEAPLAPASLSITFCTIIGVLLLSPTDDLLLRTSPTNPAGFCCRFDDPPLRDRPRL